MKRRNKSIVPPMPDVCDSCSQEEHLTWDRNANEWLCNLCRDLIIEDRRLMDYENGKKMYNDDSFEW